MKGIATDGIGDIVIGEELVEATEIEVTTDAPGILGSEGDGLSLKFVKTTGTKDVTLEDGFAKWLGPNKGGIGLFGENGARTASKLLFAAGTGSLAGAVGNGLSAYEDGDKIGSKQWWKQVELGAISGAAGGLGGSFFGDYKDISLSKGILKGLSEGGAKTVTNGFVGGVEHGGYTFKQDLKLGLYSLMAGFPTSFLGGLTNHITGGEGINGVYSESIDDINDGLFGNKVDDWIKKMSGVPADK